jgi:hypothetical protein
MNAQTEEYVILVDTTNNPVGIMEKHEAHRKALLHNTSTIHRGCGPTPAVRIRVLMKTPPMQRTAG